MEYVKFDTLIDSTQYGYTAEVTSPDSGDAKYLRITDIMPYFVDKTKVPYCNIDASKINKYLVHPGDLLIARTGSPGYNLVVDDSFHNYVFASYLIRFYYNKSKLLPEYLKYVLKSPSWYGFINNYVGGSVQPGMNAKAFGKYSFPYTDICSQQKIASILSAYDSQIENNQKRIKLLEQMAENLYKEWFVRFRFPGYETAEFEGGVPKGWQDLKAQDVFNITIGRTPSRKVFEYFSTERENNTSWVSISDMKNGMFIDDTSEYLTPEALKACNMPLVKANTVLLSFKLTVGKVAISLEETSTNEAIAHFNTEDKTLREYTYLYLKCFNYSKLGNTSAIGNAINSTIVKNMSFVLPTRDILIEFHKQAQPIFETVFKLTQQATTLAKQRDLLLPRLMSGKFEL